MVVPVWNRASTLPRTLASLLAQWNFFEEELKRIEQQLLRLAESPRYLPQIYALLKLPGVGVLIREDAKPAIEPMGRCLADVMRRVEENDPLVALTDEDVDRLVNWDAEKYRQTLKP